MPKRLLHLTNIHEAAQALHKLLLGTPGYLRSQVITTPSKTGAVIVPDKCEIVVYVTTEEYLSGGSVFNTWPVRYEIGNG